MTDRDRSDVREKDVVLVAEAALAAAVRDRLAAVGASPLVVEATTRAMMHASRLGVDSHGVRLTEHYVRMMEGGRVNPRPNVTVRRTAAGSAVVNCDDGPGHVGAYRAVELGCEIAREAGVAAVGVEHSSHFGAAGAYALAGAEDGFITFATTNTDSVVTLHDGAAPFHGTNPIALAAPVPGERPWLFDMATSSIPMNRVLLYRSLNKALPEGVAADEHGYATIDPFAFRMLLPLGGTEYGYKGAGLAGLATLLSAVLMGTTLDHDFIPMYSEERSTPRNMGHFVLVIDPERFAGRALYEATMSRYVAAVRAAPRRGEPEVMAPGDREWKVADARARDGIPIDPDTARFLGFA